MDATTLIRSLKARLPCRLRLDGGPQVFRNKRSPHQPESARSHRNSRFCQATWSPNGECDDIRFEGLGMAGGLGDTEQGHDALDCRQLCELGVIARRDY